MAYLTLFCTKISKKIPTYWEGGGVKPVGPNSQILPKFFSGASLTYFQYILILLLESPCPSVRKKIPTASYMYASYICIRVKGCVSKQQGEMTDEVADEVAGEVANEVIDKVNNEVTDEVTDMVADMKVDKGADMKLDMVADMEVDNVADMDVDMVADMKVVDMKVDKMADMEVDMLAEI